MSGFNFIRRLTSAALWSLCGLVVLSACQPEGGSGDAPSAASAPADRAEMASVMVDSVNYMHDREVKYTLYDLSKTPPMAVGGAIVVPLGSGGEKGCCLGLPPTWQPGMKVRVVWGEAKKEILPGEYTRDLEIPKYDIPADLYVVFYPGQEVEVVVSRGEPGHELWAGREKQTPWDACVAAHGRKPCFAALPKQFDTGSLQGYCPEAIKNKWPQAEESCEFAMYMCMKDYEDEPFCKGILWGEKKK